MAETGLVRGRVARFTRLDFMGRPVYGEASQAVTRGIVDVTLTPNVEEGEAATQENFAGEQCIQAPAPCPTITNWTVAIQFCAVDPCVVLMIYPSWIPYFDDFGNIKGYQVVGGLSCDVGFALEIWGNVALPGGAQQVACGPGAVGGSRYLLLPRLVGGAPGDITVSGEVTTFTFNGTTTNPVGWRRGPYLVDVVDGQPSVLREPVVGAAQLVDITTNVQPPAPTNGCVELPRPIPEEANIIIDALPNDPTGQCIRMIVDNHGFGPVTINWGDETDPETAPDCSVVTHCYAEEGTYEVCVADEQTPAISTCRTVEVPIETDDPIMTVAPDPSDPLCVLVTLDMPIHSDGRVRIHWGDETEPGEMEITPGEPVEISHCYITPGVYQIRAERMEQPEYYTTETVIVPVEQPPEISASVDGLDVLLTVDNHGNGLTTVDWGDGTTGSGPATDGGTVTHTYASAGTYEIRVTSVSNPLSFATVTVTIGDEGLEASVDADDTDSSGQTAVVTWITGGDE